jgi:hypothetical protein
MSLLGKQKEDNLAHLIERVDGVQPHHIAQVFTHENNLINLKIIW